MTIRDTTGVESPVTALVDAPEVVRLVQRVPDDAFFYHTDYAHYWNWVGGVLTVWFQQGEN